MADFHWFLIVVQLINIIFSVFVVIYFVIHTLKLRVRAETQRFVHLYPYNRGIFVLIFVLLNIAEIIILAATHNFRHLEINSINVYFTIGTIINSGVLIFQVYVMRLQIKKQYPYSYIHRIYWIYLPCVSIVRIILQCVFQQEYKNNLSILILNIILFLDCLGLAFYSIFFKRQQIQEFQQMKLFELDNNININLLEKKLPEQPLLQDSQGDDIFPLLNIQLKQEDKDYIINVYCKNQVLSRKVCTFEQIQEFYNKTKQSNIKHPLIFDKNIIQSSQGVHQKNSRDSSKVKEIQIYINQILSSWLNYTPQVLNFLSIPQDRIYIYVQEFKKMRQLSKQSEDNLKDKHSIYFDVFITKLKKIHNHYQFGILIRSWDNKYRKQIQKRYTQIQEFDKKLRSIEIRSNQSQFKIKTPQFPEKYFFHQHDVQLLEQRKLKLELYFRRLLNDKNLMERYKEIGIFLLEFIGLSSIIIIQQRPFDKYKQLYFETLQIVDIIQEDQLVTYYEFKLVNKNIYSKQFKKRYKQFNQFHKELKRWLHNSQNQNKSFNLPPKLLNKNLTIKQKQNRHRQLCHYLNTVANGIPNITDLYEFRVFLELQNVDSFDFEEVQKRQIDQNNDQNEKNKFKNDNNEVQQKSMSVRIDELGDQI